MKLRRYCCLATGILILAAAEGFFAQTPAWKGLIETIDGVKVVRNPAAPLYGDVKFDLEQDLQIGKEDDDNYIFGVISSIQADDEGNIYVCDIKLTCVQKYDKNGRFLATIGKKGQGPGEYENPFEAFLRPKASSLYVRSNMRVLEYDSTGAYKTQTVLRHFPYKTGADGDGNIWTVPNKIDGTKETRSVEKNGRNGETLWSSAVYPYERYRRILPNGSMVSGTSGWEFDVHFVFAEENTIWYGYSGAYEMTVIDKDGKSLFKVVKDDAKEPFGAADKKPDVSPDYKPFFYGLTSDDAGRIYATRANMMATAPGKPCPFDVFGRDGICLYSITLPRARVFTIKNGYFYGRDVAGEDDLPVVKRYRIKNWSALKATADAR
jgi:hypothetical protein